MTITDTHEIEMDTKAAVETTASAPVVPANSISGRSLLAIIAIMTFLASLTMGAVVVVGGAARAWQSQVSREVTIQIRPVDGRDVEAEVAKATEIARAVPGIADVSPFSKQESARLLEPWLGAGLSLDDLPVPRMIVVKIASGADPDFAALRKTLAERVVGASLDDHRAWLARMAAVARAVIAIGVTVLGLVVAGMILCVTFATRGAMATNRPIIEVLHFCGAKDGYIAGLFQHHFLKLGLKGGALGGGLAIALFLGAQFASAWFGTASGEAQLAALFGTFSLGFLGYLAVIVEIVAIALITALTSRLTVNRTLGRMG